MHTSMLYILSVGLSLFLLIGVLLIMFPDLISPSLADRWVRNHKYWRH